VRFRLGGGLDCVDFGGQNEIVFGETIDGVSPQFYFDIAPAKFDVGMVAFGFGLGADFVYKIERPLEVFEFKIFDKVAIVL